MATQTDTNSRAYIELRSHVLTPGTQVFALNEAALAARDRADEDRFAANYLADMAAVDAAVALGKGA